MPHVCIEFSEEIGQHHDIQKLCDKLFDCLSQSGVFEASAIKIRAVPVACYRIGSEPQSFVHATLLLMDGRDEATRKGLNKQIVETLREALPDVGSISAREEEIIRATYVKDVL